MREFGTDAQGKLIWGGKVAELLADEYGTPLVIYDQTILNSSIRDISSGPWEVHYALKANPAPQILKTLHNHGIGIDAVSANEVEYALSLGFPKEKIVYTSSSLSEEEAKKVHDLGVLVNLNSLEEIDIFGDIAPETKIGIRINPDVRAGHHQIVETATEISKFGIHLGDVEKAVKLAGKYKLQITMAHFHIGSGILDKELFVKAFENVLSTIKDLDLPHLTHINLGGGFGTPYHPDEARLDLDALMKEVAEIHHTFSTETGTKTTLVVEPGRYLVNECGVLLTNLNTISRNEHRTFYRTDSGFNHLIRPAMYSSYHHFVNASSSDNNQEEVIVSGNICEGGDIFNVEPRTISKGKHNDKIAIFDVGAYGVAMGMELYNLRGLPAEIMINTDETITEVAHHQSLDNLLSRYNY